MVIRPHDLIKIDSQHGLLNNVNIPDWVYKSLENAPYVVVRRAPIINGKVPVGVRGIQRNQRFGTYINQEEILNHIPYTYVLRRMNWRLLTKTHSMPAVHALGAVSDLLQPFFSEWGPGGSVGFELVSGAPTVNKQSDLDLIVYAEDSFAVEDAGRIINHVEQVPVHVDIQVETGNGAFSLKEFAKREHTLLMLKTKQGPYLVEDPWMAEF